jgi:hypothetical protein
MTTRASLHGIVDDLPDDLLPIAELSLARLTKGDDEFWAALVAAPEDDEPLTEVEHQRLDRAWELLRRGVVITDDELDSQLGE